MKKLFTVFALAAVVASTANAQILYGTVGSTLIENFDGLINTGNVADVFSATSGTQSAIPGLTGWQGAKLAGTGVSATDFVANAGTGTGGGLYSFGTGTGTDRALGALASGTNAMAFGAVFLNNTGFTLTGFTITYDAEFWRSSTTQQNALNAFYGFSTTAGLTGSNFLSSASMTPNPPLNLVGPLPVISNGALDGNAVGNRVADVTNTINSISWAPGASLFIAWRDLNDAGDDAGLAVDNFRFVAIPEPAPLALLCVALAPILIVRRLTSI